MNLNEGIDAAIRQERTTKSEKLDKILDWILMNKCSFTINDQPSESLQSLSTDFVCFRGLLTTLMCTPYERREDWEFVAIKFKQTIYLCTIETEQKRTAEQNKSERQKEMSTWGYKFEEFVLSDNICDDSKEENNIVKEDDKVSFNE